MYFYILRKKCHSYIRCRWKGGLVTVCCCSATPAPTIPWLVWTGNVHQDSNVHHIQNRMSYFIIFHSCSAMTGGRGGSPSLYAMFSAHLLLSLCPMWRLTSPTWSQLTRSCVCKAWKHAPTGVASIKFTFLISRPERCTLSHSPLSQQYCRQGSGPWIKRHYLMRREQDGCSM